MESNKMESNKMESNKMEFQVICNNEQYLNDTLNWYNKTYKTDFKIVEIISDEVNFARIRATVYNLADVFALGYQFGAKEQTLRHQNKIDW